MKITLTIIGLIAFMTSAMAQTYEYTYDNMGNRIGREIIEESPVQLKQTNSEIDNTSISNELEINVYPNPVITDLSVSFNELNSPTILNLFTSDGKLLIHKEIEELNVNIDFTSYKKGVYFIEIQHDDNKIVKQIVKQ